MGDPCRMELYFKSFFYMLIMFFSGSQTSITAFEAMVTLAAVLAKGSSAGEDFLIPDKSPLNQS